MEQTGLMQRKDVDGTEAQVSNRWESELLSMFPVEIMHRIVDFLPLESVAALSICCKDLLRLLGTQHLSALHQGPPAHSSAFLSLVANDLPNHIACSHCIRLHSIQNMGRYNITTYDPDTQASFSNTTVIPKCVVHDLRIRTVKISSLFGTTALDMAIKRYKHQLESKSLLTIMSSNSTETKQIGDFVRQSKEECRIIGGRLMHRLQNIFVSRKRFTTTLVGHDPPPFNVCRHMKLATKNYTIQSGVRRCQKCRTECHVRFRCSEKHGLMIFVTRWMDLGNSSHGNVFYDHLHRPRHSPPGLRVILQAGAAHDGRDVVATALQFQGELFKFGTTSTLWDSAIENTSMEALTLDYIEPPQLELGFSNSGMEVGWYQSKKHPENRYLAFAADKEIVGVRLVGDTEILRLVPKDRRDAEEASRIFFRNCVSEETLWGLPYNGEELEPEDQELSTAFEGNEGYVFNSLSTSTDRAALWSVQEVSWKLNTDF
jgi:hypothetical protein